MKKNQSRKPHEFVWVVPLSRVFPWWYLVGLVVTFAVIVFFASTTAGSAGALWGPVIGLEIKDRQERAAKRMTEGLPVRRSDLTGGRWFELATALILSAICAGIAVTIGALFDRDPSGRFLVGVLLLVGAGVSVTIWIVWGRRRQAAKRHQKASEVVAESEHDHTENEGDVPAGLPVDKLKNAANETSDTDGKGDDRENRDEPTASPL